MNIKYKYPKFIGYIDSIPNKQYISDALSFREWLQSNSYWARLDKQLDQISITYGRILSNGPEKAIATRTFYMYKGEVVWFTVGHV